MSPELVGLLGLIVMVVLVCFKLWLGAVFIIVGFLGYGYLSGIDKALMLVGIEPLSAIARYNLTTIPTFILMGTIVAGTGVGTDLYNVAYKWIGRVRGGLAMATIASCGMFAAVCGSSMATAVTMGKVAIPEMKKYNYETSLASGSVAAGGTLGILIPPSTAFILYGILTEQSIGKLFMSGIIPGILQIIFYILTIYLLCVFNKKIAPAGPKTSFKEKVFSLKNTWAMIVLFMLVMGGMYTGVFTATEAGAVGAFGAIMVALVSRRLNWNKFRVAIVDAAQTTGMIGFILIGSFIFNRFLSVSRLPVVMGEYVSGLSLSPLTIIIFIILFYILVGCVMDIIAAMVITIPIIFPVISALGFDPIWFGVIIVRMFEIGAITPPVGMNVFALAGATGIPAGTIYRGIVPFLISDFAHVALIVAVPALSLYLPNMMR